MHGSPVRAAVYARVSTDAQEKEGTSLETQTEACVQYARDHGYEIVPDGVITDTASGADLHRPGLDRVRELARQQAVDVLVFYAIDRLSRDQDQLAILYYEFQDNGERLECVTENFEQSSTGTFLRQVKAFVAQYEREKIAERTMRGKQQRAKQGKIPQGTGRGCYGYIYDPDTGTRRINPEQAEVVKEIFTNFVNRKSLISIVNDLRTRAVPCFTAEGNWHTFTVRNMLKNESYAGNFVYRRTKLESVRNPRTGRKKRKLIVRDESQWIEAPGASPRIVEQDLFDKAQAILNDPERRRNAKNRVYDYALSGRVRCAVCGRAVVGQTVNKKYHYYRCRSTYAGPRDERCTSGYVSAHGLEFDVLEQLSQILADPQRLLADYERLEGNDNTAAETQVLEIQSQLEDIDKQKARLIKLFQLGEIAEEYLTHESANLKTRRGALEHRLQEAQPLEETAINPERLQKALAQINTMVEGRDQELLDLLIEATDITVVMGKDHSTATATAPLKEYARENSDADVRAVVSKTEYIPFTFSFRHSKRSSRGSPGKVAA